MRRLCPHARATIDPYHPGAYQAIGDGRSDRCSSIARPSTPGKADPRARVRRDRCWPLLVACSPSRRDPTCRRKRGSAGAGHPARRRRRAARERAPGRVRLPPGHRRPRGLRPALARPAGRPQPRRADLHLARRPDRPAAGARSCCAAADRGVRVRLLLDDMDARAKNAGFAALDAHPNIEVRLFNPFASRSGTLGNRERGRAQLRAASTAACTTRAGSPTTASRSSAAATSATILRRQRRDQLRRPRLRDGRPGRARRIGVVRSLLELAAAYPMRALDPDAVDAEARSRSCARGSQAHCARAGAAAATPQALRDDDAVQRMVAGDRPLHWTASYAVRRRRPAQDQRRTRDARSARRCWRRCCRDASKRKRDARRDLALFRARRTRADAA